MKGEVGTSPAWYGKRSCAGQLSYRTEQKAPGIPCLGRLCVTFLSRAAVRKNPQHSPNCWMARSALQGNSSVMCTRRFWFFTRLSAWREIPELEASEIIATS